jgi:hypothetical protein
MREAGLPVIRLPRLTDELAARLLDLLAPELPPRVRARVLAESAGNPLALTELPDAIRDLDGPEPVIELTDRLERAFTGRAIALSPRSRTALLVAALDENGSLAELLAACGVLLGDTADPGIFGQAVDAGLVEADRTEVRFGHPLMRSAIPASAGPEELRRAHQALADVLRDHPDRRAWHRAGTATGPDEDVAADLERAAERARYRAGAAAGVAAMEQAAKLSPRPADRADRLPRAAGLAVEAGRRETAERLVLDARACELSDRQRATARWLPSGFDDGVRENTSRVTELAELASSISDDGQAEPAMRILWGAAMRCFWSEPGPVARQALLAVADRLSAREGDPRAVAINAYVAPFERGAQVLDELRSLAATAGADPEVNRYLGSASLQIGAFGIAARFSAASVPGLRALGQLGVLPRALAVEAWCWARLGGLASATAAAAEAA